MYNKYYSSRKKGVAALFVPFEHFTQLVCSIAINHKKEKQGSWSAEKLNSIVKKFPYPFYSIINMWPVSHRTKNHPHPWAGTMLRASSTDNNM